MSSGRGAEVLTEGRGGNSSLCRRAKYVAWLSDSVRREVACSSLSGHASDPESCAFPAESSSVELPVTISRALSSSSSEHALSNSSSPDLVVCCSEGVVAVSEVSLFSPLSQ
ncbi:hypothetical protein MRX96_029867 [Rhipicephalus microplus]